MLPDNPERDLFFLQAVDDGIANLGQEFADAQYALQKNELKAWILLIASLDEDLRGSDDSTYVFDAIDFADKLGIDARKARGRIVADIFVRLSHNFIDIRSRADKNGDQDVYHIAFIYKVRYHRKNYRLEIGIPPDLKPYLFALKKGTFFSLDVKDILALNTVSSMRLYIYLRGLARQGISSVSISELRNGIGMTSEYYNDFRQLKHKILEPATEEIRKHTGFKNFYLEDNGAKGRKATHIHFSFSEENEDNDLFLDTSPTLSKLIKNKFSTKTQIVIRLAMDAGFNPRYIGKKFDNIPENQIVANFNYVLNLIHKEKKADKTKSPEIYGRYFLKATEENWAANNQQTEEMLRKNELREQNAKIQKQIKQIQEKEEITNLTESYRRKAMAYINDFKFNDLENYIDQNFKALNTLAGKVGFDKRKALSRKKNYREYRILTQFALGKLISGEITAGRTLNLF